MPSSISKNSAAAEKLRAYKNPEQCLTDFSDWFQEKSRDPDARAKYEFTVAIAPYAKRFRPPIRIRRWISVRQGAGMM